MTDDRPFCPRCGSAKTQPFGPGVLGLVSFLSGSCLLWIPVIGWVLAPILFVVALVFWVGALFTTRWRFYRCGDCGHGWKFSR